MVEEKRRTRVVEEERTGTVKKVMCGVEKEEEFYYSVLYALRNPPEQGTREGGRKSVPDASDGISQYVIVV